MEAIFSEILNMSLTASVVILVILLVRVGMKKVPKIYSYALWSVVLFRLLCPVSIASPVSVLEVTNPEVTQSEGITTSVSYIPAQYVRVEPQVQTERSTQVSQPREEAQSFSKASVVVVLWAIGVAVMLLRSAAEYIQLRRKLVGAIPLRDNIYLADHIDTPFAMGILLPRIYLPSGIPSQERRYIVAHEQHHIRRGDHIIKLLAYFALSLHWFNPLAWVAFVQAGKDMEMSCDEAVLRQLGPEIRADYSASLLRLATGQRIISGTPLAFGEGDTKGRIRNMAKWKKTKVWVSALCVVLCVAILVACAVNPRETTEETAPAASSYTGKATAADSTNILLAVHPEAGETHTKDAFLLLTLDADGKTAEIQSIPGNISLDAPNYGAHVVGDQSLGACYHLGSVWGNGISGAMEYANMCLENHYGIVVDYNAELPESDLIALINALGGVTLELTQQDISDFADAEQSGFSSARPGVQTLDGVGAMDYAAHSPEYSILMEENEENTETVLRSFRRQRVLFGTVLSRLYGMETAQLEQLLPALYSAEKLNGEPADWTPLLESLRQVQEVYLGTTPEGSTYETLVIAGLSAQDGQSDSPEELAFEKVKAVFDAIRGGSYEIQIQRKNEGNQGPSGSVTTYCYDDENWLSVTEMVLEGTNQTEAGEYYNRQAYLYHKGFYYSNEGHWGEQGAIRWSPWSGEEVWTPILASFHWNSSNVTYLDTVTDENGQCLMFRIDKKYVDHESYTDHYFANFYFDQAGNFRNAVFQVNQDQDNAFTATESIVTLDAETVAKQIDSYYGYGIPVKETTGKPVISGGNIVTNLELVQYGELSMALTEGYGCREENGSIILTNDGTDIGGITCWAAPDFDLIYVSRTSPGSANMAEWIRALGLPEAQESDEPIAYMIGNGMYGDLEAEYFNELNPEKLNVEHHFFIEGELVYDVYYNQNLISDGQAEKFLKTIQISGQPVVTPDPSEEESLIKCRNILSLIQSGSFAIASDRENKGTIALNDYSYSRYWQHGGNWLSVTEIPESGASGYFHYMEVDGVHYNTERTGWDENGPIWAEQQPVEVGKPWLATFRWNDANVAYIDTLISGGEECVMLRIDEPYPYGTDNAESYFVNFYFADGGAFLRADLSVNLFMDNAFDVSEAIITLDAETVAAEIQAQYIRATN